MARRLDMKLSDSEIQRLAQAMLDDIGNEDKLDMSDPYRRIITVQLSSADIVGMTRAVIEALDSE